MTCRTLPLSGSIRASEPSLSVTSQTLSVLVVTPPSAPAGPDGKTALTWLRVISTLASFEGLPHSGIQTLPKPTASPEQGSPSNSTVATRLLVRGSMRCTAFGPVLPTQTSAVDITTQS